MQRTEIRYAVRAQDYGLAVDHEMRAAILRAASAAMGSVGPVMAATTISRTDDLSRTVVFDLMKPLSAGRLQMRKSKRLRVQTGHQVFDSI